ncbi:hypothetical protein G6011_06875 [Alternaria panax]|uniref:Uncharacterized protein n=1 Tax=Alternaria panax TaxID=48097 RepID=A0AAD4F850_9PLEO|nr:hypothetical protein G6011_06875 [Alternaria panax]
MSASPVASVATEFGDGKIRDELMRQTDEERYPVYETRKGALKSAKSNWTSMIKNGPPEHCFSVPVLDEVPFPDVLARKAYSLDGESVGRMLYNGRTTETSMLGFKNMKARRAYTLGEETALADHKGKARLSVNIDTRAAISLRPVD